MTESYEYSATGCKKKTHYVDLAAQGPNTNYSWGIEGTDGAYSAPGAVTLSTYYNEREQPTEVHFLDAAGCQVSRVDLLYDDAGRLVEEAQTHSDEVLPSEMLTLFGAGGKFAQRAPSVR